MRRGEAMASGECEDRAGLHGRRTVGMSLLLLQPERCLYDELPVDEHAQELDHIVPKRPQRMRVRVRARGGAARGPKGHRTAPRADALVMFSRCGVSRATTASRLRGQHAWEQCCDSLA